MQLMKTILLGTVLAAAGLASAANAPDPAIGTWKLNVGKSKMPPGHEVKSLTRVYTEGPDGVSLQVNGVAADGSAIAQHSTFKYDGKSYPFTGSGDFDAVTLKRVNGTTLKSTQWKAGKPVGTSVRTVSEHGKLMTLDSKIKGADGKRYEMVSVFDKQ